MVCVLRVCDLVDLRGQLFVPAFANTTFNLLVQLVWLEVWTLLRLVFVKMSFQHKFEVKAVIINNC